MRIDESFIKSLPCAERKLTHAATLWLFSGGDTAASNHYVDLMIKYYWISKMLPSNNG